MLTRKQLWRRVTNGTRKNTTTSAVTTNDSSTEGTMMPVPISYLDRSFSDPMGTTCQSSFPTSTLKERAQSSVDLTSSKKSKHVQFSGKARVVLIPCLNEYRSHHLHHELWWKDDDYLQFKHSAKQEISHFLEMGGDIANMMTQLYQSHHNQSQEEEIRTL